MKVKIREVDVGKVKTSNTDITEAATAIRFKKMPVSCLPFPTGADNQAVTVKWQLEFKANAIHFAASLPTPFSSNSLLHDRVREWWDHTFDFTMEEHWTWTSKSRDALPAVVEQASDSFLHI